MSFRGGVHVFYPKGFSLQWQKCHAALQLYEIDSFFECPETCISFQPLSKSLISYLLYPIVVQGTVLLRWCIKTYKILFFWEIDISPSPLGGGVKIKEHFGELSHPKMLWGLSPRIQWLITIFHHFPIQFIWLLQGIWRTFSNSFSYHTSPQRHPPTCPKSGLPSLPTESAPCVRRPPESSTMSPTLLWCLATAATASGQGGKNQWRAAIHCPRAMTNSLRTGKWHVELFDIPMNDCNLPWRTVSLPGGKWELLIDAGSGWILEHWFRTHWQCFAAGQASPDLASTEKSYGRLGVVAISGKAATLAALDMILKPLSTRHVHFPTDRCYITDSVRLRRLQTLESQVWQAVWHQKLHVFNKVSCGIAQSFQVPTTESSPREVEKSPLTEEAKDLKLRWNFHRTQLETEERVK